MRLQCLLSQYMSYLNVGDVVRKYIKGENVYAAKYIIYRGMTR